MQERRITRDKDVWKEIKRHKDEFHGPLFFLRIFSSTAEWCIIQMYLY